MQRMKETAANVGASAKSGLEKTKAAVQEKKERMTAHDPMQKEMATERKEERMRQAELDKQEAREHNEASRQAATTVPGGHGGNYTSGSGTGTGTGTTARGAYGHPTAGQQMSAMPGHGTGQPTGGHVVDDVDVVGSRDTQHGGNYNASGYGTTRSGGPSYS